MSRFSFSQLLSRLRDRAGAALLSRVVWVTDIRADLVGGSSTEFAWVAVIGREHYDEARKTYPIRGWSDLRRVLRIESGGDDACLSVIGPLQGDERAVTTYRLSSSCPVNTLRALFWVPETLLLEAAAKEHGVITVERAGLRYFVAANGISQRAGGAIRSPQLFALASGVPADAAHSTLGDDEIRREMAKRVPTLSLADWWSLRSPVAAESLQRFLRPAASFSAVALLAYLGVASAYLAGMEWWRNRQLEALGSEVTVLLAQQRAIDVMAKERTELAAIIDSSEPAWPIWEIAATVWRGRGAIYSVNVLDDEITLRCTAPVATEILDALRKLEGYSEARFDSAVRPGGLGQEFVVTLQRGKAEGSKK
jgi:hypothetical protein